MLLSDCCHSGTIWDIPETLSEASRFPPNILSVSASTDRQTAKQARIGRNSQGIFTFNFFTVVRNNPGITIGDVQKLLTPELSKFGQQVEMYPTRQEMLYRPHAEELTLSSINAVSCKCTAEAAFLFYFKKLNFYY